MEDRLSEVLTHSANYIPSGRQLPRSPPMTSVKRYLDFDDAESVMPTSKAEVWSLFYRDKFITGSLTDVYCFYHRPMELLGCLDVAVLKLVT